MRKLTSLSLCSGSLGLDLGMESAGIKTVAYVDKERPCRETILRRYPTAKVFDDIFSDDLERFARTCRVDIVAGGPPCQPFSPAGKRRFWEDPRAQVIDRFIKIVGMARPEFFILENVDALASKKKGIMPKLVRKFAAFGYRVGWQIVNAQDFGVPQSRKRLVMFGRLSEGALPFLAPTCASPKTLGEAIMDIQNKPGPGKRLTPRLKALLPIMKKIPEGKNWKCLPPLEQKIAIGNANPASGGLTGYCRRLSYSAPSPTLTTSPVQNSTMMWHPTKNRPLSLLECKRIQGFPDEFFIGGSIDAQYRQVGNAVPVQLGAAIGRAIIAAKESV